MILKEIVHPVYLKIQYERERNVSRITILRIATCNPKEWNYSNEAPPEEINDNNP